MEYKPGKPDFRHIDLFARNVTTVMGKMRKEAERIYTDDEIVVKDKYMYLMGNIPIMLVAHVDTKYPPSTDIQHDKSKNVLWSNNHLGADDRAGVAAIREIIRECTKDYKPSVALLDEEEKGCIGAKEFASDFKNKVITVENINAVIELDRRGANDAAFYDCDNKEFTEYIKSLGFNAVKGSCSDIKHICPAIHVAGVNLPIGFENEHEPNERLFLDQWQKTLDIVKSVVKNPPERLYAYVKKSSNSLP